MDLNSLPVRVIFCLLLKGTDRFEPEVFKLFQFFLMKANKRRMGIKKIKWILWIQGVEQIVILVIVVELSSFVSFQCLGGYVVFCLGGSRMLY